MKRLVILTVLVGLVVGGWSLRGRLFGSAAEEVVERATVTAGPLRMLVQTTGSLRPVKSVPVGSEVSGTVASLGADFNERVKAGQVLAKLKTELFESRVAQAEASHENAAAALRKAETALEDLKKTLPLQTALARAAVDEAQAAYDVAEYNWNRVNDLYTKQNAPEAEWRAAKAQHVRTKAAMDSAQINLERAKLDETIRVSQMEQDVALARATLAQARASLELARQDLERCTITAPIDGVVLRRLVNVGEPVVSAFTAQHLFIITPDLTRMELYANVSEADIGLVHEGQKAEFTVDACGERVFPGKVTLVRNDPTIIQGVVTYQVLIAVDNADGVLKPEMTASVSIEVVTRDRTCKISNAALRFRPPLQGEQIQALTEFVKYPSLDGTGVELPGGAPPIWASRQILWDRTDAGWIPLPVWVGITDGKETEILAGLEENRSAVVSVFRRGGLGYSVKQAMQLANPGNRSI